VKALDFLRAYSDIKMATLTFEQVNNLKKKGLNDEQISSLATKHGYDLPKENLFASAAKTLLVKPAARLAEAVGRTGLLGENVKRGYEEGGDQSFQTPFGEVNVEEQRAFGSGGGRQIVADALESGSYLAPVGKTATALTNLTGKSLLSSSLANATAGYAADVSANVRGGEDGLSALAPGGATAFSAAIPFAGRALGSLGGTAKKVSTFMASKLTGLNPQTVITAVTNPAALSRAEREGLSRVNIATQVETALKKRIAEAGVTGAQYKKLIADTAGREIPIPSNTVSDVLKKFGVELTESGKIKLTRESAPLSPTDVSALERFISQYGSETTATTNSFLNTRKALDQLSDWEAGKTDIPSAIGRQLRKAYDSIGKNLIPGLKELDDKMSPQLKEIEQFKKHLFNDKGELLDTGINTIANATGLGRDKVLNRLEKIVPGIGQQLQLVKALEDIASTSGNKVGTYTASLIGGGAGLMGGGIPGMIVGLAVASPAVTIPILKVYGKSQGIGQDVIERVVSKIDLGNTLNPGDLMLIRKALENHIANLRSDKFDDEGELTPQQ
jgi:hypothetical protein